MVRVFADKAQGMRCGSRYPGLRREAVAAAYRSGVASTAIDIIGHKSMNKGRSRI